MLAPALNRNASLRASASVISGKMFRICRVVCSTEGRMSASRKFKSVSEAALIERLIHTAATSPRRPRNAKNRAGSRGASDCVRRRLFSAGVRPWAVKPIERPTRAPGFQVPAEVANHSSYFSINAREGCHAHAYRGHVGRAKKPQHVHASVDMAPSFSMVRCTHPTIIFSAIFPRHNDIGWRPC